MEADEEIPSADHTYGSLTRLSAEVALLSFMLRNILPIMHTMWSFLSGLSLLWRLPHLLVKRPHH